MKYDEFNSWRQKQVDDMPVKFAFSKEQFDRILETLKPTPENKLVSLPGGGYCLESDVESIENIFQSIEDKFAELCQNESFLFDGFVYEMGNREYQFVQDDELILDLFNKTTADLKTDPRLQQIYKKARKYYLSHCSY